MTVRILGIDVDPLVFLQVMVTIVIILLFSFFVSTKEASSERTSDARMVLLVSFIAEHTEGGLALKDVVEVPEEDLVNSEDLKWFKRHLEDFQKKGTLPSVDQYEGSPPLHNVGAILVSPIFGLAALGMEASNKIKFKEHRIQHTEARKDLSAKYFLLFSGCLGYLLLALVVMLPSPIGAVRIAGYVLAVLSSLGLLATMLGFLLVVRQQYSWKEYWQDRLLVVLASAARRSDHDLFNRSSLVRREIAEEPDIPIPGALTAYALLFSIIQTLIIWISNRVTWL